MRRLILCMLLAGAAVTGHGQELKLPMNDGFTRFAVIGDGGTAQQRVADRLAAYRAVFPFEFAIMLGDNLYGSERPRDYERKFERPYKPLLDAGVKFFASLGNHDDPPQRFYKLFNMGGARYYTFMLVEIAGDEMHFQTIDADGRTVDAGALPRQTRAAQ